MLCAVSEGTCDFTYSGDVGGGVLMGELVRSMVASGVMGEFFSIESFSSLTVWFVLLDIALMSLVLFW